MHLNQIKLEGRNVEYDAFEGLNAAAHYAFGKDALQKDECHPQAPDANATSSISPFIANYQKMTLELQLSHVADDTLSDLERLQHQHDQAVVIYSQNIIIAQQLVTWMHANE